MRISDWSSDVCSSDLVWVTGKTPIEGGADAVLAALRESQQVAVAPPAVATGAAFAYRDFGAPGRIVSDDRIADRKSVVEGKGVSVRVDLGGRRIITKKKSVSRRKIYRATTKLK